MSLTPELEGGGADALLGGGAPARRAAAHPVLRLVAVRVALGILTLFAVSVLVFAATQLLPGNVANAVLGQTATPQRVHAIERQLDLNRSAVSQYLSWIGGVVHGDFGVSLASRESVISLIGPRIGNSAVLVLLAGVIGTLIATLLGIWAAARRDSVSDHALSVLALVVTALPEFVVGVGLVLLFAVKVFHLLPAVSTIPPGESIWSNLNDLVLPVATLALVIAPYNFRMVRSTMIEALESEYVETAQLKGLSKRRIIFRHALPNALPPIAQVVGLNLLYLAGGIVVVEYVFNYPGLGSALIDAVSNRDIPTIQAIVLILAAFYVVVNIATDVIALLASPRRRTAR